LSVENLRTPYGPLSWKARAAPGGVIDIEVRALRTQPPGGITLRGPWPKTARVRVDGRVVTGPADAISLTRTPVHVRIEPEPR
jgi:hypothetical protein